MRYMLLICSEKTAAPPPAAAEMDAILQGHRRVAEELRQAGKMLASDRLRPDGEGARIRVKAGHRHVTDGPFTETKEVVGGFYLIDCASQQEAVEWANKIPLREGTFIEVRPVWEM